MKPMPQVTFSSPTTTYVAQTQPVDEDPYPDNIPAETGQDYANEYKEAELKEYLENYSRNYTRGSINTLSQLDDMTLQTLEPEQILGHNLNSFYEQFDFTRTHDNKLSINSKRHDILQAINSSQVTIIEGATGCGKTTQVLQFILDDCYERKAYCNIIVTQPRKIAAISIARRVCKERNWVLGELVGYQVGLDMKSNENTRLQYVTTGVLLQRLAKEHHMNKYTHIILDEVHERDQEMDFTLLVVRKLLRTNSPFVKVILMSATFNTLKFSKYFAIPGGEFSMVPCPVINVTNRTEYNVKIIYLDMIKNLGVFSMDYVEPGIDPQLHNTTSKLIQAFNEVDLKDFRAENEAKNIPVEPAEIPIGSVLMFLPGIYEIECIYEELNKDIKLLITAEIIREVL